MNYNPRHNERWYFMIHQNLMFTLRLLVEWKAFSLRETLYSAAHNAIFTSFNKAVKILHRFSDSFPRYFNVQ